MDWAALGGTLGAVAAIGALAWTVSTSRTKLRKAERLIELAAKLGVGTPEGALIDGMARRSAREVYVRSVVRVDFFTVYAGTILTVVGVADVVVFAAVGTLDLQELGPSLIALAAVLVGPIVLYVHLLRVRVRRKALLAETAGPVPRARPVARTGGPARPPARDERR